MSPAEVLILTKAPMRIHRGYQEDEQPEPFVHESCNIDQSDHEIAESTTEQLSIHKSLGFTPCKRCFPV